jgi:hypothetical protein
MSARLCIVTPQEELEKEAQSLDNSVLARACLEFAAHGIQLYLDGMSDDHVENISKFLLDIPSRVIGRPSRTVW